MGEQAFALDIVGLGAADAGGAAQGLSHEAERHVGAHRIATADEQLEGVAGVAHALEELVRHARLAAARGAADDHHLGRGLVHAFLEKSLQVAHLAVAADAGDFPAEHGARGFAQSFFE